MRILRNLTLFCSFAQSFPIPPRLIIHCRSLSSIPRAESPAFDTFFASPLPPCCSCVCWLAARAPTNSPILSKTSSASRSGGDTNRRGNFHQRRVKRIGNDDRTSTSGQKIHFPDTHFKCARDKSGAKKVRQSGRRQTRHCSLAY